MRIECPCCGPRNNGEFAYLGDATPVRPDGMAASQADMSDYVHLRDNRAGLHSELWYHAAGCRSWLVATRNTQTHEIEAVVFARGLARSRMEAKEAS